MNGEKNLSLLLANLRPVLHEGKYVYCQHEAEEIFHGLELVFMFKEKEGVTAILEQSTADSNGMTYQGIWAWITLSIHSSLNAVGLMAKISTELALHEVPCNVASAYYHDHIFVPYHQGEKALDILRKLGAA